MKHFFIFILLISYCSFFSLAQQNKIDSLENLLRNTKEDTSRMKILTILCFETTRNNPDASMRYAQQALTLAEKYKNKSTIASVNNNIGTIYRHKGNYDSAMIYHSKSLKLFESIGEKSGMAGAYNNIGNAYYRLGNYSKALENYLNSLKIQEALQDKQGIAIAQSNLGMVFGDQGDYKNALDYFFKSLKEREETNDKKGIAISLNNIGEIYSRQKSFQDALQYHLKALKMRETIGDKKGIAESLFILGVDYLELKDEENSLKYFNDALGKFELNKNKNGIGMTLISLGQLNLKKKNFSKAIDYLKKGQIIAEEMNAKPQLKQCYQNFSEVFLAMGDYKEAYKYSQLFSLVKDSIFNEESQKQITEMQTKYETEKKEKEILLLQKDSEIQKTEVQRQKVLRNAVFSGLLLVILFSFVLINRFLLIRKQKTIIEIEREKSEKLLLNILPKDTADELKRNNAVTPKRYEQVTVMFTDFKGFTTIAEKMSAEGLVSELDFIFKKFDEIISKYPIEKIKTIGDAYMCAGGLPVANTTNPMDVVMAALEIQEFMCLTPNPYPKERGGLGWGLRIGIHTGSVIAGVVGDKKFAYDIWGDTVNTASRMESSGEAGKVNISGETYRNLTGFENLSGLKFQYRGKIPAKNKGEIEMYFVERAK